jgi:hypothetical protein
MKPISTRVHGILDYLSVAALIAAPHYFEIGERVTPLLFFLAAATLAYSLLTRYQWGAFRVIPMPCHLALDISAGIFLVLLGLLFIDELDAVRIGLVLFGLFEIAVGMLSQDEPAPATERPRASAHLTFPRRSRHV